MLLVQAVRSGHETPPLNIWRFGSAWQAKITRDCHAADAGTSGYFDMNRQQRADMKSLSTTVQLNSIIKRTHIEHFESSARIFHMMLGD